MKLIRQGKLKFSGKGVTIDGWYFDAEEPWEIPSTREESMRTVLAHALIHIAGVNGIELELGVGLRPVSEHFDSQRQALDAIYTAAYQGNDDGREGILSRVDGVGRDANERALQEHGACDRLCRFGAYAAGKVFCVRASIQGWIHCHWKRNRY